MDNLHFLDTNIILAMVLPNDNSFEEAYRELYEETNISSVDIVSSFING